jgi:flagellar biosynthesis protein FliQ
MASPWYIATVSAAVPAILTATLSPIVVSILARFGTVKDAATLDYLNKRLAILERLDKLRTH